MQSRILILIFISIVISCNTKSGNSQNPDKLLEKDEIIDLSEDELRIKRNEIFARYGYIFKSEDLKSHFEKLEWYEPRSSDVTELLSEIDKKNIELLLNRENELKRLNKKIKVDFVNAMVTDANDEILSDLQVYFEMNRSQVISDYNSFWETFNLEFESYDFKFTDTLAWKMEDQTYSSIKLEITGHQKGGGVAVANNLYLFNHREQGTSWDYQTEFYLPECGTSDYEIASIGKLNIDNSISAIHIKEHTYGCCGASDIYTESWVVSHKISDHQEYILEMSHLDKNNDHCSGEGPTKKRTSEYYVKNSMLLKETSYFVDDELTNNSSDSIQVSFLK